MSPCTVALHFGSQSARPPFCLLLSPSRLPRFGPAHVWQKCLDVTGFSIYSFSCAAAAAAAVAATWAVASLLRYFSGFLTSVEPSSTHMEAMLAGTGVGVGVGVGVLLLLLVSGLFGGCFSFSDAALLAGWWWNFSLGSFICCACVCVCVACCCFIFFFFFDYLHPSSYALTESFLSRHRPSSAVNMTIYAACTSSLSLSLSHTLTLSLSFSVCCKVVEFYGWETYV